MTATDPFVHDDGAYVLGALSDVERAAFEAHLLTCSECRQRVAAIAPLPDLLAGVGADAFAADDEIVPDTLLPALLRAAQRERTRRRVVVAALGGLAAACIAALVLVIAWPSHSAAPGRRQAMTALVAGPVSATATLSSVKWGTEITLRCHYATGYPTGLEYYSLVVVDKAGHTQTAGSWQLVPGKDTTFTSGTAIPRGQIGKVEIAVGTTPILTLTS